MGKYFKAEYALIPLSVQRVRVSENRRWTGLLRVRIFGVLIAELHAVNPWSKEEAES